MKGSAPGVPEPPFMTASGRAATIFSTWPATDWSARA